MYVIYVDKNTHAATTQKEIASGTFTILQPSKANCLFQHRHRTADMAGEQRWINEL
jgi:hypothetical protein